MEEEIIHSIIDNIWVQRVFWSIVVIIGCILLYSIVSRVISTYEKKNSRIFSNKKNHTYIKMLKSVIRYILIIACFFAILGIFNVDTSSMLAGAGIVGIMLGFAVQDVLKDVIKGFDILSDNYYSVGDIISFKGQLLKVMAVGLKTTRAKDIQNDNIVSIANRNIDQVEVVSGNIIIDAPLPYELSTKKAESILNEALKSIEKLDAIESTSILGLDQFGDSALIYKVKLVSTPEQKIKARRDAMKIITDTLESHKLSVPYTQIDLHQK